MTLTSLAYDCEDQKCCVNEQQLQQAQRRQYQRTVAEDDVKHTWEIRDKTLPLISAADLDSFDTWPDGNCLRAYSANSAEALRHSSGWAMRNTNNHNSAILKKSCLGILVCSRQASCSANGQRPVRLRPAICDKARRKQIDQPCPRPGCDGRMVLQRCTGLTGYPVTHFWRTEGSVVYFQSKGEHNPPPPDSWRRLTTTSPTQTVSGGRLQKSTRRSVESSAFRAKLHSKRRQNKQTAAGSMASLVGRSNDALSSWQPVAPVSRQPRPSNDVITCTAPTLPQSLLSLITDNGGPNAALDANNFAYRRRLFHSSSPQPKQYGVSSVTSRYAVPNWSAFSGYDDARMTTFPSPPPPIGDYCLQQLVGLKCQSQGRAEGLGHEMSPWEADMMSVDDELKFSVPGQSCSSEVEMIDASLVHFSDSNSTASSAGATVVGDGAQFYGVHRYANATAAARSEDDDFMSGGSCGGSVAGNNNNTNYSNYYCMFATHNETVSSCFNDYYDDVMSVLKANICN